MSVIDAIEGPVDAEADWLAVDWPRARRHVSRLQARIVKAVKAGKWHRVRCLQRLLRRSFYAKLLAGDAGVSQSRSADGGGRRRGAGEP